ncbi:MAG: hypothetical protein KGY99_03410 [Phycisphaerae bacterium]|nr:hypothetical protein [Phycisphaerae bacterium]
MNRNTLRILMTAGLVLVAVATARGQVGRINYGRALDANPLVGGGRRNVSRTGDFGVDSQLYVTGQVTGLGRFRGDAGYQAANELRLTLPSTTLSGFRRQSVGIESVLGGATHRTAPYFDPAQTTFELRSGGTGLGSQWRTRSGDGDGLAERIFAEATRDYEALMARGARREGVRLGGSYTAGGLPDGGGLTGTGLGEILAGRERRLDAESEAVGPSQTPLTAEPRREERIEARLDGTVESRATGREMPPEFRAPEATEDGQVPPSEQAARTGDVAPNQDVYLDMLLRQQELRGERRMQSFVETDTESEPTDDAAADEADEATRPMQPIVEIDAQSVMVRSLAGRRDSAYNARMAEAQRRLQRGEFYRADESSQAALLIRPASPLPRVGRTLAMLAAGEPLTAAILLREAMELYPPLMETRMDVARMMGKQIDVLQQRLVALDERTDEGVATRADRSFVFLSAYLHQCLGQTFAARQQAAKLADAEDDMLAAFARYVLTGKRPGEAIEGDGETGAGEAEGRDSATGTPAGDAS